MLTLNFHKMLLEHNTIVINATYEYIEIYLVISELYFIFRFFVFVVREHAFHSKLVKYENNPQTGDNLWPHWCL